MNIIEFKMPTKFARAINDIYKQLKRDGTIDSYEIILDNKITVIRIEGDDIDMESIKTILLNHKLDITYSQ